ncbi:23S rRNA (guanosine2251-2'-O)-methyltransferase [Aminivibrio pyruvatiphilus]|uniref:23S rRNA (Guanosine2251-2'-O)-methyltransferase n=1 Tax=Aminivibrio pyruvatiphilus TaxID=1005740 RepID=A0A4R8LWX8_9BACT|nr:23S rRNA (guanosine(2251)-2'-O)-methyltransferase RlmB [Aminivibrio pyruvatiphilus]TDY52591.1 23S rRNA (guanosine2251-2'-O)-methyltransferase [Aminivibrio pyruvatiphilus]
MDRIERKDGKRPAGRRFGKETGSAAPRFEKKRSEDLNWGRQVVLQLLKESPDRVQKVFLGKNVSDSFSRQVKTLAEKGGVVVQVVTPEVLSEICGPVNHQGVACRSSEVSMADLGDFFSSLPSAGPLLVVVLDHVQDPHNLGAVARTAEACGAKGVLFPKRRGALPGGTVVKVSAGAALRLPMVGINNVSQTVKELQEAGFWTIGLDNRAGRSLWSEPMPERTALIVGAEGEGLSRLVSDTCDEIVRIPLTGETGSLNASVACAVGMFEWARKWGPQS